MKNIAVLIFDLTVEYNIVVVDGIIDYLKKKDDVHVIISTINAPHNEAFQYDYQYWTALEFIKSDNIDAAIVVTNSFCHNLSCEDLAKEFACLMPKPVISVSNPLDLPTNHYTCISCRAAYDEIIGHLIEKHNRKKIAFLSAALTHSPESAEREKAFRAAMKKHGLKVNEDWIFKGDFTPRSAYDCFKEKYKSRKEVPFDALLCANDYMAAGAESIFADLGVSVPEDVCVFGFDDAEVAVTCSPNLSTISQKVADTGYKAAELVYKILSGKKAAKVARTQAYPLYRQSCGCMDKNLKSVGYYNNQGQYHERDTTVMTELDLFGNGLNDMATIYHVLNMTDSVTIMNEFFKTVIKNLDVVHIRMLGVVVYEEEIELSPQDDFVMPEKAKLLMLIDEDRGFAENYYDKGGIEFNPHKELLPNRLDDFARGNYYLLPIFLQGTNYGYLVCRLPTNKYPIYTIFLKILVNSFVPSYVYSKKETERAQLAEKNQTLNFQSKTDELTKLFNRRGFMEYGQQLLDISSVSGERGCVFFCDLDGLKTMNDTWGHEIGDLANGTVLYSARIIPFKGSWIEFATDDKYN